MKSYKATPTKTTGLQVNNSYVAERLELRIERILNNGEPISDTVDPIYVERAKGVQPAYDIRTDKWEIAIDGMDGIAKGHQTARQERFKERLEKANKDNAPTPMSDTPVTGNPTGGA